LQTNAGNQASAEEASIIFIIYLSVGYYSRCSETCR